VAEYDAIIVGSGINSLACAALLARADWRVCVLERNDWFGGAIKTEELTEPGFLHDVFSAWHPLWVGGAAHAELGNELAVVTAVERLDDLLRLGDEVGQGLLRWAVSHGRAAPENSSPAARLS